MPNLIQFFSRTNIFFARHENLLITLISVIFGSFLIYAISNLSISSYEARIFYSQGDISGVIARLSCVAFGQNDYALRMPFLFVYLINSILIYKISKFYLKRRFDRVISMLLFMMLPASLSSAILVNTAGIFILISLLCVFFWHTNRRVWLYLLLILIFFVDKNSIFLYATLLAYAYYARNLTLAVICTALFIGDIWYFDYEIYGKPRGYFLNTFVVFAGAFSPFILAFFIYSSYRILLKDREKPILFFISSGAMFLAFVLSFRQRLHLENFLPLMIICAPLIVKSFFNSYRIRLPRFRRLHKISAFLALSTLFLFTITTFFNQNLYTNIFKNSPQKHFAYKYDVAKDLSIWLKTHNINAVNTDENLALRLKFYGIENSERPFLKQDCNYFKNEIEIYKSNVKIAQFCTFG